MMSKLSCIFIVFSVVILFSLLYFLAVLDDKGTSSANPLSLINSHRKVTLNNTADRAASERPYYFKRTDEDLQIEQSEPDPPEYPCFVETSNPNWRYDKLDVNDLQRKLQDVSFAPTLTSPPWLIVLSSHVVLKRRVLVIIVYHELHARSVQEPWHQNMDLKDPADLDLWCIFEDGTKSPVVTTGKVDTGWGEAVRYLMCSVPPHAEQLYSTHNYLNSSLYDFKYDLFLAQFSSKRMMLPKKYLTVCTSPMSKLPPRFDEWLEYHRLIGAEHFVIYQCFPREDLSTHPILARYIKSQTVTIVNWCTPMIHDSERNMKNAVYMDSLYRFMDVTEWLMIIDPDEYTFPTKDDSLLPVLQKYEKKNIASIRMDVVFFGPCPQTDSTDNAKLIIQQFTQRPPEVVRKNFNSKSIYRTERTNSVTINGLYEGTTEVWMDPWEELRLHSYYCAIHPERRLDYTPIPDDSIDVRFSQQIRNKLESFQVSKSSDKVQQHHQDEMHENEQGVEEERT